jgi:hypothetical protein
MGKVELSWQLFLIHPPCREPLLMGRYWRQQTALKHYLLRFEGDDYIISDTSKIRRCFQ